MDRTPVCNSHDFDLSYEPELWHIMSFAFSLPATLTVRLAPETTKL